MTVIVVVIYVHLLIVTNDCYCSQARSTLPWMRHNVTPCDEIRSGTSDSDQKLIFDHDQLINWSVFKNQFFDPIINFRSYMINLFSFLWWIFSLSIVNKRSTIDQRVNQSLFADFSINSIFLMVDFRFKLIIKIGMIRTTMWYSYSKWTLSYFLNIMLHDMMQCNTTWQRSGSAIFSSSSIVWHCISSHRVSMIGFI